MVNIKELKEFINIKYKSIEDYQEFELLNKNEYADIRELDQIRILLNFILDYTQNFDLILEQIKEIYFIEDLKEIDLSDLTIEDIKEIAELNDIELYFYNIEDLKEHLKDSLLFELDNIKILNEYALNYIDFALLFYDLRFDFEFIQYINGFMIIEIRE